MDGEAPLYVLKPSKARILVPNSIKLILLCVIFYTGILLNVSLLEIAIPFSVNILIVVVLVILILLETMLTFIRLSKIQYIFYSNRMQVVGPKPQYVMFSTVSSVTSSQNLFDKIFNTGTIMLGTYKMTAIGDLAANLEYMQKLVQSSRYQYLPQ